MGMLATPIRSQTAVRRREAGQALVFTALAIVVLMGFAGLGIDMGILRYEKRLQQNAADAAAIAGASNLNFGGVQTAGQNAAAANGFTDNGGGARTNCEASSAAVGTVCVQISPAGPSVGPHAGDANYVEAYVSAVQPTYFMRILNINKAVITARAVAGGPNTATCLYTTPTLFGVLGSGDVDGAGNIAFPVTPPGAGCGMVSDNNINLTGAITDATSISAVGSAPRTTPLASVGIPTAGDPLAGLMPLTPGGCTAQSGIVNTNIPNPHIFTPGNFCGGISINTAVDVTFQPGIYFISGGFNDGSPGTITGNNVTFYILSGGVTLTGANSPQLQLTAPTIGQNAGILFWQEAVDTTASTIRFGGTSDLEGILYFPSAQLTTHRGNVTPTFLNVIANSLDVATGTLSLGGNAAAFGLGPGAMPLRSSTLVE